MVFSEVFWAKILFWFSHYNWKLHRTRLLKFWSKTQYCSIKGRLYVNQISVQCLPVSILLMLMTWILFTGLRTGLNSGQKVSKPTLTPAMSWRNPMFLTEKTEDNGQLERFSGINSFGKVVQNDLICYTGCCFWSILGIICNVKTSSGHPSIVINHDPILHKYFFW